MALPLLVSGGADCGPVNPLSRFTKQFDNDRATHAVSTLFGALRIWVHEPLLYHSLMLDVREGRGRCVSIQYSPLMVVFLNVIYADLRISRRHCNRSKPPRRNSAFF